VVGEGLRRPDAKCNVEEHVAGGHARAEATRLVHELADTLVARARQPKSVRLGPDAPPEFGDRHLAVVEPFQRRAKARRDSRREGRHHPTLSNEASRPCHNFAPSSAK
jgi:hypothetical protein